MTIFLTGSDFIYTCCQVQFKLIKTEINWAGVTLTT